jgi:release factor glutamine methyltransferase
MKHEMSLKKEIGWLLDEKYDEKLTWCAKRDIAKLKNGHPLAYLIGNQLFINCKIDLKYKPLIPRPETEYWTEKVIEDIKKRMAHIFRQDSNESLSSNKPLKILDMFSGSGCIGVAILKNSKNVSVDFADIKRKNLKQIKRNIYTNKIKSSYKIIKSDIFTKIDSKYDCIVANPPYISYDDKEVQSSVKKHEPKNALYSKKDGLELIERFLRDARNHLKKDGKTYMEFGYKQKEKIETFLKKFGYIDYTFHKDQYGKWRWLEVR